MARRLIDQYPSAACCSPLSVSTTLPLTVVCSLFVVLCASVWPLLLAHVGPLPFDGPTAAASSTTSSATTDGIAPATESTVSASAASSFFIPRNRLGLSLCVELRSDELVVSLPAATAAAAAHDASAAGGRLVPLLALLTQLHAAVGEFVLEPTASLAIHLGDDSQRAATAFTQLHSVRGQTEGHAHLQLLPPLPASTSLTRLAPLNLVCSCLLACLFPVGCCSFCHSSHSGSGWLIGVACLHPPSVAAQPVQHCARLELIHGHLVLVSAAC